MIQIAICDDEPILLEEIKAETEECLKKQQVFSMISTFSDSERLLYELEEGTIFDLFLLDIEMPGISGMELAGRIHEKLPEALIIFVTAHYKYAIDAYELNIFRYIPKNQIKERLPHAVIDAVTILENQNTEFYLVSNQNRIERIPLKNVVYIIRDGKNAAFYLEGTQEVFRVRKTLSKVYESLNPQEFVYIDRGCIINLKHLSGIANSSCTMADGTVLAVAQSRSAELKKLLNEFWRERI